MPDGALIDAKPDEEGPVDASDEERLGDTQLNPFDDILISANHD